MLAAAAGSSLNGAPMPGGGFVAFGVPDPDGRTRRDVVVFDAEGRATAAFELPERVAPESRVVAGGDLYVYGYRCDDPAKVDDVGQQQCTPGTLVGLTVDLASGAVDDLPSPVLGGYASLLRMGDRAVAFTTGTGAEAWIFDDGRWESIAAPPGPICQVGDRLAADVTDRVGLPDSGTFTQDDLDDRYSVKPAVQLLDSATLTWDEAVVGPPMPVSMMGLSQACTAGRVTSAATFGGAPVDSGTPASTSSSFDVASSTWSDVVTIENGGVPVYGHPEADALVSVGRERQLVDPVTGVASPTPAPFSSLNTEQLAITGTRALVFDPANPGDRLQVVELVAD